MFKRNDSDPSNVAARQRKEARELKRAGIVLLPEEAIKKSEEVVKERRKFVRKPVKARIVIKKANKRR